NTSADNALRSALTDTAFTGSSDLGGLNSVRWVRKNPIACIMGEDENSIVNRWGGEVHRFQRRMDVRARLGADNGVSIRYGKNLTGLDFTTDVSGVITRIMPTGLKEDGQTVLELPETFVDSPLTGTYAKIRTEHIHYGDIKVGEDAYPDEASACEALRARAASEFKAGLDKPTISVNVSFVDLSQTIEYAEYSQLETVSLGDTVHIWHGGLGVDTTARVISIEWDCLRKRYVKLTLGGQRVTITNILHRQNQQVVVRTDALQVAVDAQTSILLSPGESYVRFMPSLSNPAEIFIMDASELEDAVNVMRLNRNGWGLSTSGINGPFITAATAEGLSASAMTTGELNAALIRIMGSNGTFWDNNYIQITDQNNPNRIMRYGLYDGVNSGLAFSTDGGVTWGTAVGFDGAHFGDTLGGFTITANGLTNGSNVQILSNGDFKLGNFQVASVGGNSRYKSLTYFSFSGNDVFNINDVAVNIHGDLVTSGEVNFLLLPTTSQRPNLYVDQYGQLYKSTATW
ncbi:phage tail protein, partial [Eubacteriales bacterium OttesenSCG-928-A19]|nr:phage tail protein [Eubacteriales bacterium OttesenSCG-928-A19]